MFSDLISPHGIAGNDADPDQIGLRIHGNGINAPIHDRPLDIVIIRQERSQSSQ